MAEAASLSERIHETSERVKKARDWHHALALNIVTEVRDMINAGASNTRLGEYVRAQTAKIEPARLDYLAAVVDENALWEEIG